jgi:hypothetical protein
MKHPLALAMLGGMLWFIGGVLSAAIRPPLGAIFCLAGGLVLGNLAARVKP